MARNRIARQITAGAAAGLPLSAADPLQLGRRSLVAARRWVSDHREALWVAAILAVAALAHGFNMFQFPYYENDEGAYAARAWSLLNEGKLDVYTYWYDHAPAGSVMIALWHALTGGFYTFGTSIESGRVLMLVLQIASTLMVYRIARGASGSVLAASIASVSFALSPLGIFHHRRILLDNILTFWMLLSIVSLAGADLTLKHVWFSALALGISILSKELTIFLVPVLAYLIFRRAHPSQRWFATIGWVAIVASVFSVWFLLATLKNELFPTGTWLGGTHEHVSLLGSLQFQTGRGRDGGLFNLQSSFWEAMRMWARDDQFLVVAGSVASAALAFLSWRYVLMGSPGLVVLSLLAFLGRGGVTYGHYVVPLLPLLAVNAGVALSLVIRGVQAVVGRVGRRVGRRRATGAGLGGPTLPRGAALPALALLGTLGVVARAYAAPGPGLQRNQLALWTNDQARAQREAANWITRNVAPGSRLIADDYLWIDLHDPSTAVAPFTMAHWYWKVEQDPEIRNGVFGGDWRNADLVVRTSQMDFDAEANGFQLIGEALQHSTPIVHMDTGGWSVEIRRVHKLRAWEAAGDPVLVRSWFGYLSRFVQQGRVVDPQRRGETTSEGQSYALLRAVYVNDRRTFDEVWEWTKANLQVRGDGLLAWRWGRAEDGKEGVLDLGAATDADQDTALALLFASRRWNAPEYREEALRILRGIWDQETTVVGGRRVVVAGDWARGGGSTPPVVNPSYLAPYAYRIFAQADPDHPWTDLAGSSYVLLDQIARSPELGGAAGLVGNWVMLDPTTGAPVPASEALLGPGANLFSYDASRTLWRLALDWLWFKDDRARRAIAAISLPARELAQGGRLAAEYRLDGTPAADYEALSMYAGSLGGLLIGGDQEVMHRVFAEKILGRYADDPRGAYFGEADNYYDQNWAWFAAALMDGSLGNLWAGDSTIDWNAALADLGTAPVAAPSGAAGPAQATAPQPPVPPGRMILGPGG